MESFRLITHNILFLSGGVINVALAIFVWVKMRRAIKPIAVVFILFLLSVAMFQISHALGIMANNADASRMIFMLNLANIPIGIFLCHWFILMSERSSMAFNQFMIPIVYITGIGMLIYFLMFPETFLLPSVPKLYFPFYYNPGPYQIIMRIWFNLVGLYYFYELFKAYTSTADVVKRNRYKYVLASLIYAFILGSTAILLVYNINFDPFYSSFFGLFTIPLVFIMIKYELLDIKIVAKQAAIYSIFATVLFLCMTALVSVNQYVVEQNAFIPSWFLPLAISICMVLAGIVLWRKIRSTDVLKYEFINIISHKFRTPLTYVKWETESLMKEGGLSENIKERIAAIADRNSHLIELTNTLVTLAESEDLSVADARETFSLQELIKSEMEKFATKIRLNNLKIVSSPIEDDPAIVLAVKSKISFVLSSLIDNAITYTPAGGTIEVRIMRIGKMAHVEVRDSGIGFDDKDRSYIFSKFYRSDAAQSADTEGMGINLFITRQIVESHGGKIEAFSEGVGRGSSFSFSLPLKG